MKEAPDSSGIGAYFHCGQCLNEKPDDVSPRDWSRTQTGLLPDGRIRVWCVRHDREVVTTLRPRAVH